MTPEDLEDALIQLAIAESLLESLRDYIVVDTAVAAIRRARQAVLRDQAGAEAERQQGDDRG
jgi:hypothetical protein